MTRTDDATEREALKDEIKGELKREGARRKAIGCGSCFLLMAAALAIPTFFVLSTLAKTGFVNVPLLSGWLYRPALPVRVVRPLVGSTREQVMQSIVSKVKYDQTTSSMSLMIGEMQATTLVQAMLDDAKNLPFAASSVQAAVEPEHIEFYFVSVRPGRNATVRVRVFPEVKDGKIVLTVNELLIGSLNVPPSISRYLITVFGNETEKALNEFAAQIGQISDISLRKGTLTAIIRTKNK